MQTFFRHFLKRAVCRGIRQRRSCKAFVGSPVAVVVLVVANFLGCICFPKGRSVANCALDRVTLPVRHAIATFFAHFALILTRLSTNTVFVRRHPEICTTTVVFVRTILMELAGHHTRGASAVDAVGAGAAIIPCSTLASEASAAHLNLGRVANPKRLKVNFGAQ